MSLEIVIGPMFSGKSSYALSYARRYRAIGMSVQIVKPNIDSRYTDQAVMISHDREQIPCLVWDVNTPFDIDVFVDAECIIIEEAQFFPNLKNLVKELLIEHKLHILLVGLDGDSSQNVFGDILQCVPLCTKLTKLNAYCCVCQDGTLAPYTKRLLRDDTQILVGSSDMYQAVCLKHL
jgi:thymidine kinase